ncbi:hypothetical protein KZ820_14215 [Sphingomonas sp. RRHST34]|uniref:Uncharacterized protein n=1 Tax=Sphingomonas citri TaxID=2862499 RepID=A0ABS7BQN0_9SPHN|nr:hypothetical protein [Sphingomonas citri]MBW6531893.1 hypothetical protein [Sphingomonas citri]
MKRMRLELRRARGWLAFHWVCHLTPAGARWLWWPFLSWAGLYAHWDYDRANWNPRHDA